MNKSKSIIVTIITVIILALIVMVVTDKMSRRGGTTVVTQSPSPVNIEEYVGVISPVENGYSLYTNNKYHFTLKFPNDLHVGDNHLGYGTFQLLDFNEAMDDTLPQDRNKIELFITSTSTYGVSQVYSEKNRKVENIVLYGQYATMTEVGFIDNSKVITYSIRLPSKPDLFLSIAMYGNGSKFYLLDNLVKTLTWIK